MPFFLHSTIVKGIRDGMMNGMKEEMIHSMTYSLRPPLVSSSQLLLPVLPDVLQPQRLLTRDP